MPQLVRRMRLNVDVHEAFAIRWPEAAPNDDSWMELAADLRGLLREWIELTVIVLDGGV